MSENLYYSMCLEEYKAYTIYRSLSKNPLIPRRVREVLEKASRDEREHYEFWKSLVGECAGGLSKLAVHLYVLVLWLFGLTVVLKLLERGEAKAMVDYRSLPSLDRKIVERIVREEEAHERLFVESLNEARVKYIGSIALGVTDALVELTGIYAGSLGIFASSVVTGLVGLVAGLSASISMGVASYTQAKHTAVLNPVTAAFFTMVSYMAVAVVLALPYFLISSVTGAFVAMVFVAILVVAYMSFYASILQDRRYTRELLENAVLILGIAGLLYLFGSTVKTLVGIEV